MNVDWSKYSFSPEGGRASYFYCNYSIVYNYAVHPALPNTTRGLLTVGQDDHVR